MKLIIDIDDKTYNDAKQFYDNMSEYECIGEYELAIAEGIPLKEKTNGEVIKTLFPNYEYKEDKVKMGYYYNYHIRWKITETYPVSFDKYWWNKLYEENKE